MSDKVSQETQDLVDEVIKGAKEAAPLTESTDKVEAKDTDTKGEKKNNATKRIQELVEEKNEAKTALDALLNELNGHKAREASLEAEAVKLGGIVDGIRQLAGHDSDEVREAVFLIDKVLKGKWEPTKSETETTTADVKADDVKSLLSKHTNEITQKVDAKHEAMVNNLVKQAALERLSNLPEEYLDDDKKRLAHVVVDYMDLDAIKEDPSILDQAVDAAFKATLDWYGEPNGKVKAETLKTIQPKKDAEVVIRTPKEQKDALLGIDWDAVDEKGKAKHSDKDYVKALQAALKLDKALSS